MFESLLGRIARELDQRAIPYMVIGGQAVLVYAEPRFTRDIDITLGVGPDRLDDILGLALDCGWKALVDPARPFVEKHMVLPCEEPSGIRIDLIFSFSPYEAQALERVRRIEMDGQNVRFASPEDLVVHKVIAGRARDLEDVASVLRMNPGSDLAYIRHWLGVFSRDLGRSYVERFEETLRRSE